MMMRLVTALVLLTAVVEGVPTVAEKKASTTMTIESAKKKGKGVPNAVPRSTSVYSTKTTSSDSAPSSVVEVLVSGDTQTPTSVTTAALKENPFAQGPVVAGYKMMPQAMADGIPSFDNFMTYVKLDTPTTTTTTTPSKRELATTTTPPNLSYTASFSPSVIRFSPNTYTYDYQSLTVTLTPTINIPNFLNSYSYVGVGIVDSSMVGVSGSFSSTGYYYEPVQSTFSLGFAFSSSSIMSGNYSVLIYTHDSNGNYHYFSSTNSFQVINGADPKGSVSPLVSNFQFKPTVVKPSDTLTMSADVKWFQKYGKKQVTAVPSIVSTINGWMTQFQMPTVCSTATPWKLVSGDAITGGTYESDCTVAPKAYNGNYYVSVSARNYNTSASTTRDSGETMFQVINGAPFRYRQPVVHYEIHPKKARVWDYVTINVSIAYTVPSTFTYFPSFQFQNPTSDAGTLCGNCISWQFQSMTASSGLVSNYTARFQLSSWAFYSGYNGVQSQNYSLLVNNVVDGSQGGFSYTFQNALQVVGTLPTTYLPAPLVVTPRVVSVVASPSKVGPGDLLTVTATVADFDYNSILPCGPNQYGQSTCYMQLQFISANGWPCNVGQFVQVSGNASLGVYQTSCVIGANQNNYYNGKYGLSLYIQIYNSNLNSGWSPVYDASTFEVVGAYDSVVGTGLVVSNIALSPATVRPGQQINITATVTNPRGVSSVYANISTVFWSPYTWMPYMSPLPDGTWFMKYYVQPNAPNGQYPVDVYVQAFSNTGSQKIVRQRFVVSVTGGTGGSSGGASKPAPKPTAPSAKHHKAQGSGGVHKQWFASSSSGGSKGGANVNVGVGVNIDVNTGK